MRLRTPSFILCSILAAALIAGSLTYGLIWGVPQWMGMFHGQLDPLINAYGGWAVSTGMVALAIIATGIPVALSWFRGAHHYLLLALGMLSVLAFITLGLPAPVIAQIQYTLSFLVMGMCGLSVVAISFAALKDRFSRRYRV